MSRTVVLLSTTSWLRSDAASDAVSGGFYCQPTQFLIEECPLSFVPGGKCGAVFLLCLL